METTQKTGIEQGRAEYVGCTWTPKLHGNHSCAVGKTIACAEAQPNPNYSGQARAQESYRDAAAQLCLKTVALALCVPLSQLVAANRCKADIALARQIAMYLAHTQFSMAMTEVGLAFGRDRTTVSHACRVVEDKRDEDVFDLTINQLEGLLGEAVIAIEARCRQLEGGHNGERR